MPGTIITERDAPSSRSAPTDDGTWFVIGIAEKGPATPVPVGSLSEFKDLFGGRVSYGTLYDPIDVYFREGGHTAIVSRVFGPSPVAAHVDLNDTAGTPVATMRVTANSAGDWANTLNAVILLPSDDASIPSGQFVLKITDDVLGTLEQSPSLVDVPAAVAWAAANSEFVVVSDLTGSSLDPASNAGASFTGGTDDHGNATDATWLAAANLITADYGPGQISYPGRTTDQAHLDLLSVAKATHRTAVFDYVDTASKTTLKAASVAARGNATNARGGGGWAWWTLAPGVANGTTRTVPPSAFIAALCSRIEAATGNPNEAPAGELGQAQYVIDLSQPKLSRADLDDLSDSGVNVSVIKYGGVRAYGNRTVVDKVVDPLWADFANTRLYNGILWRADAILEKYVERQLDGKGVTIGKCLKDLIDMLTPFKETLGALHDFYVDMGPSVNTPTTEQQGKLKAKLTLQESEHADTVELEVTRIATTEAIT